MMYCLPKFSDSFCAMRRPMASFCPPGANGTIMRTGRVG
jgi:hypothetical protein